MKNYPKNFLINLYKTMLRIRLCEESFVEPILKKEIKCPVHLYTGEEAVAAGVCAALTDKDYIFGNHRSHGHYLAKGGNMNQLVAEIYGKETGCSRGRGGSMHLIAPEKGFLGAAPIVAGTISLAVGAGLASKIRKDKSISVSFFGDGATGEGVLYEALNLAALKKLPVIFVCENNFYSTHLPLKEIRAKDNIWQVALPFGVPSHRVDGNDVLAVFEAAKKAVSDARRGKGPSFIECRTYRLMGHVGPDDNIQGQHTEIRPKSEVEKWRKKEPVGKLEKLLLQKKLLRKEDIDKIKEGIKKEVADSHILARRSPLPKEGDLKKYVFNQ